MLEPNTIAKLIMTHSPKAGLKQVSFECGDVLARQGDEIAYLYLPDSGMVSYTVDLEDAQGLETGSIGRHGAIGAAAVFGSRSHLDEAVATLRTTGWAVGAARINEIADEVPGLRMLLFKVEQYANA